jgi:hypothetical protein
MIQTPRIDYRIRDDATPHAEINALANVYRLVLDSARKRGRPLDKSGPDGTKTKGDSANASSLSD